MLNSFCDPLFRTLFIHLPSLTFSTFEDFIQGIPYNEKSLVNKVPVQVGTKFFSLPHLGFPQSLIQQKFPDFSQEKD
jgi:hypothetical protein